VAGKHTTVGSLAKALLQQGMPDEQVLKSVLAEFPEAKTKLASVQSYKSQLKKEGLLPNKASGPVVASKPIPGVAPVPSSVEAAVAAPASANVTPSAVKLTSAQLKTKGLELMKSGVLGNGDVVKALDQQFPLNAGEVNASQVATWKSLWKKADADGYAKAAAKAETVAVKAATSGPLKQPKLLGQPMGATSTKVLNDVKSYLAAGGTPQGSYDIMAKTFGAIKEPGASDLLELAQYQLATAKAAGKPYLDATFSGAKGWAVNAPLEKYMLGLDAKGKAALEAYKEAKTKGYGVVKTNKLVKAKAGYEPSASAKVKLKQAADYELAKSPGASPYAANTTASVPPAVQVDLTPTRPAATPREGLPPPPRFNSAQRAHAIKRYTGHLDTSTLDRMNAAQRRAGLQLLTAEEAAAIRSYTGSTYRTLNSELRSGRYASKAELQAYVDAAQHGLNKMPKYEGLSSRGMSISPGDLPGVLSTYRAGSVVEEAAFVSSSTGEQAAFGGNVFLRIQGRNGVNIAAHSKYQGEHEVLFMPGTRFRVDQVKQVNGKYIVDMTEV